MAKARLNSLRTEKFTAAERSSLAKQVIALFDHWNINTADRLAVLGLASNNRAALSRYRIGQPLANRRDLLDRVGHLIAIHRDLRLLFPENQELVYEWPTLANRAFDSQSPVKAIIEHGFVGLLMVRAYLDRQRVR